jgi:hypothetical protein
MIHVLLCIVPTVFRHGSPPRGSDCGALGTGVVLVERQRRLQKQRPDGRERSENVISGRVVPSWKTKLQGRSPQRSSSTFGWSEHDPEKWTPVFGKDHAQKMS